MRFITPIAFILAAFGLFCLLAPSMVSAEVFKYIDEKGRVQYSDHPAAYRQKNFVPGHEDVAYNKKNDKIEIKDINGFWNLVGHSKHLGNDTLPDEGKWQFYDNGTLTIKIGREISNTRYRSQGRLLEIVHSGDWSPYQIVSLSPKRLVIRKGEEGEYFYFKKTDGDLPTPEHMKPSHYRRDQIAKLVTMFSCTGINFSELSAEEKKEKIKEIFTTTGIVDFDEKTFTDTVERFKDDVVFKEKYEPQITNAIMNCRVPKFDTQ
jgi:hypothetical protein